MRILGIETSCDETAVSIVSVTQDAKPVIIAEEISSQIDLHALYGGVVPELAAREHLKNLPMLYQHILKEAALRLEDIDGIAVTRGPGLKGCLLIGIGFAKALSLASGKPFIGVNHIEGHILSPFLGTNISFPYIALVVSGGHTELVYVKGVGDYTLIARTIDDAAGEAFDKSANLLGFGYPGGAQLAQTADSCTESPFTLPKVMREAEGFSFSGLKTAINLLVKKHSQALKDALVVGQICYSVQEAIVDALVFKLKKALQEYPVQNIAIVGGVAANKRLFKAVSGLSGVTVHVPGSLHCTDNASMIAYAGGLRLLQGARGALTEGPVARWPVETMGAGER